MADSFRSDREPGQKPPILIRGPSPVVPALPAEPELDPVQARSGGDVRALLVALRRRWWMPLVAALAGVAIAAYVGRSADPLYQARAVIRLSEGRRAMTGALVDARADGAPRTSVDPTISLLEVLTSRAVAGRVVDAGEVPELRVKPRGFSPRILGAVELGATAPGRHPPDTLRLRFAADSFVVRAGGEEHRAAYGVSVAARHIRFTITEPPGVEAGVLVLQPREQAIDALTARLRAKVRTKTDVIDVTYTARDPATAQRVVNAVVRTFRDMTAQGAQQQSRRRREFIEGQLRRNDSLLVEAEHAMDVFRRQGLVYDAKERLTSGQAELSALESRGAELESDLHVYRTLIDRIGNPGGASDWGALPEVLGAPGAATSPIIMQLYLQLVNYQRTRDSLTTGSWARSRGHPDVLRVDTLIATTEGRIRSAIDDHITALKARLSLLNGRRAKNARELLELPRAELQEARLEQQLQSLRKLTDGLRTEYQKAQIDEAVQMGQVDVLDLAPLPKGPVGLAHGTFLLLGLIVGTLAGGAAAVASDRLNTSIRRRDEIGSVLQLPELATIPRALTRPSRSRWLPATDGVAARHFGAPRRVTSLATWSVDARGAEAYRMLRTSLNFSPDLHCARTLMVTSAMPQEGKTTVASNLAASYAHQGARVLLVDGDLRRPSVHSVFRLPQEPGLSEILGGRCRAEDTIHSTDVDNLFVLTAGGVPEQPGEPLGGVGTLEVLTALSNRFDLVVVDSPPVLVAADAAILGAAADAVVFVVRAGRTHKDEARNALRQLAAVRARVIGAVLNDPDEKIDGYAPAYARHDASRYYAAHA